MGLSIEENGARITSAKGWGSKNGKMAQNILGSGTMTRQTGWANCCIRMGIFMKGTGRKIWRMVLASIHTLMAPSMTESGIRINKKGWGKRCGLMGPSTRVNLVME